MAQRLDLERKALTGDPVTLADPVAFERVVFGGGVGIGGGSGGLPDAARASRRQLAWFDRSGKALGTMGAPDENGLSDPSVSPDGRRVAVHRTVQGNTDIWLLDGTRTSRFTFDAASGPHSPSGPPTAAGSCSTRTGRDRDLYQKASSGAGAEELLVESPQDKVANDWSADGRFLLYHSIDPQTDRDLWVLPMDGRSQAVGVPEDQLRGTLGPVLAGRALGGLHVERIGRDGDLHPAVCAPAGVRGGSELGGRAVAGIDARAASIRGGGPTARNCTTSGPMAR